MPAPGNAAPIPTPLKRRRMLSAKSEAANAVSSEARPKIARLASRRFAADAVADRRRREGAYHDADARPEEGLREARPGELPGVGQRMHRDADRVDVIAVADLHQGAQRRDADLQPADPRVLKRGVGYR